VLYLAYESKYGKSLFHKLLEKVVYGKNNEFPAKKMALFHQTTLIFTYLIPLFFLLIFIRYYFKLYKTKNQTNAYINQSDPGI